MIGASFSVAFYSAATGFFLLPIYGLSAVFCAVFGAGYFSPTPTPGKGSFALLAFSIGLAVASMALVVMARNAVLFVAAWRSCPSSCSCRIEHEREETRQAGITYLVPPQIGTAFPPAMFLVLGAGDIFCWRIARFPASRRVRVRRLGGVHPRARRVRHQGGLHAAARLAARGPPGRAPATCRPSCPAS